MSLPKTLFIGLGGSPVSWYRCALPATAIGADWIGTVKLDNDEIVMLNGSIDSIPEFDDYEVVIMQQVRGDKWNSVITDLQDKGVKVLYEIDDFTHGIKKIPDHRNQKKFHKKTVKEFEKTFALCDGMICSTDFLSDQYKKYNPNQYVCRVGIDTERYKGIEFPDREENFVIGWAGGTGHDKAVIPWLREIAKIIQLYQNVYFVSMGNNYGDAINHHMPGKGLVAPWTSIENLPYALTNFDCYIAPAHDSKYFKSKSNLRWLEGSAVGLPGVVSPEIYFDAKDEETACVASSPEDAADALMELIEDKSICQEIAENAQKYVQEHFDVSVTSEAWRTTILDIVNSS